MNTLISVFVDPLFIFCVVRLWLWEPSRFGRDARHFEPVENRKKPATVEGKSAARITTSDRYNWRYCGNAYPTIQLLMDAHAPSGIIRPRRVAVPGNRMGKSTSTRNGIHSNEMNESSGMKEREKREDTAQKQTNRTPQKKKKIGQNFLLPKPPFRFPVLCCCKA